MRPTRLLSTLPSRAMDADPGVSLTSVQVDVIDRGLTPSGRSTLHRMLRGEQPVTGDHAEAIVDHVGLDALAEGAARMAGGSHVPSVDGGCPVRMARATMADAGRLVTALADAMEDGELDDLERADLADRIRRTMDTLSRALGSLERGE